MMSFDILKNIFEAIINGIKEKRCPDVIVEHVCDVEGVRGALVCFALLIILFLLIELLLIKFSKKLTSSKKLFWQIIGALTRIQWKWSVIFVIVTGVMFLIAYIISPEKPVNCIRLPLLTLLVWLTFKVRRVLTDVFSLRKQEDRITWSQIAILISIGLWIIGFLLIFDTKEKPQIAAAIGVVSGLLGLIFQDKVRGVIAFLHLRSHHLLKINDWIMVPAFNVDGEVKRITLTTVTVYNWDTTTSTIPISSLHSGHFQNLQNMMEGKTYGRQMKKAFIFDTEWFHHITSEESEMLKHRGDINVYLPEKEIEKGALNAKLYRLYIYHWLMNHPHVSQQPRLIVRWMEQEKEGMPLQVYIFITDSSLAPFEWQQSEIIEHIIESAEWFGMRLYQKPSGYDAGNSNVHLSDKPATYRKEVSNE